MAFCGKCGAFVEDGNKFCPECGAPVESAPVRSAAAQQEQPVQKEKKKKKPIYKRWWFWVLILLVVGSMARGGSRGSTTTTTTTRQSAPAVSTQTETAKTTPKPTAKPTARPTAKPQTRSDGEIRPELKEFLDSYEAFMDEYIVFMQKVDAAGADASISLLMEMNNYLLRLSEFEEKLDALDDSDLTDAEALYYSEVLLRVSQKLIAAGVA